MGGGRQDGAVPAAARWEREDLADGEAGEVLGLQGLPGEGLKQGTQLLAGHSGEVHLRHKGTNQILMHCQRGRSWRLLGRDSAGCQRATQGGIGGGPPTYHFTAGTWAQ